MLKVDLHTHTADDPHDVIPHTTFELIDRAAALDYDALAITLHDRQLDVRPFASYAKERGVVLIPGMERTIRGKHVLLINFSEPVEQVQNFDELLAVKKRSGGLVGDVQRGFGGRPRKPRPVSAGSSAVTASLQINGPHTLV